MTVFNNTANTYTLPFAKISEVPKDKVQVFIDPSLIGNPTSFKYMTCVMVRVNSTFFLTTTDFGKDSLADSQLKSLDPIELSNYSTHGQTTP